jgi:serine/threonine-protein kinase
LDDIKGFDAFAEIEPIDKGWSGDKKYRVTTTDGSRLLLRIANIGEYERKKAEYNTLTKAAELGLFTPAPVDFGLCDGGKRVYYIATWLDGVDAAELLPSLGETERYALGVKAGRLLQKLHTLPAPDGAEAWETRFQRKIDGRILSYRGNNVRSERGELVIKYLRDNAYLLEGRPQTFNHGDFGITNIIVGPSGEVGAIDFNCYDGGYGDPLWELVGISYAETPDPHFYTGLWNGYANGTPDSEFFAVTAFYFAYDVLTSLCGDGDCGFDNGGFDEKCLKWYDNFSRAVPSWYIGK